MATIRELVKDRNIHYVQSSDTVLQVARYMTEKNVGAVPVLENSKLVGIFSERDIMKRVLITGSDPRTTKINEVMTPNPQVVSPDETIEECMRRMKQHGFRHLPVCDGDRLVGFLSLRDLLLHDLDEKDGEVKMMRAYMHATPETA